MPFLSRLHMNFPCPAMASAGSQTLLVPLPFPSTAQVGQVSGMNWAMPCAPTPGDSARGLKFDSCFSWAARIDGGSPWSQSAETLRIIGAYSAGTPPLPILRLPAVGSTLPPPLSSSNVAMSSTIPMPNATGVMTAPPTATASQRFTRTVPLSLYSWICVKES